MISKMRAGLVALAALATLLVVGVTGAPEASAQGCVWQQRAWVLDAHGSVQVSQDSCYSNHWVGWSYPRGGGSPFLSFEAWSPSQCSTVEIATGNDAGTPAKVKFTNNPSLPPDDFCGMYYNSGWYGSYPVGTNAITAQVGSCAAPNSPTLAGSFWADGYDGVVYTTGIYSAGCASGGFPTRTIEFWIYGICPC